MKVAASRSRADRLTNRQTDRQTEGFDEGNTLGLLKLW